MIMLCAETARPSEQPAAASAHPPTPIDILTPTASRFALNAPHCRR